MSQSSIEDHGALSLSESTERGETTQLAVGRTYTLWRNPDDRDDPANLAELDEVTRASIDVEPSRVRPDWLIEQVRRMRYPSLSDVVRTSWSRDPTEWTSVSRRLVAHVNDILRNHFRAALGIGPGPTVEEAWRARESAVNENARLEIDGVEVGAAEVDTDPFVYGIGARIDRDVVVTVVIARDDLPYVRLALTTRP